ncbi:deoxyribodipyrimidine photo-lyase (single-stranded DNA-specific) [Formosa sp. Hel1_31_208]|uniref:DASH family cryptochrome n=1 Tax=Formosa sp. Hel1_31_208 TaxID=1798225 RepID=UPI000879DDFC|nr:DASH family cryptochrome [Formosa sp. Hel1_31_208]SDS15365.1 deoxyribodipyrimidine photo-lyase (single-stranded DNA-specific) [Formosa sp. Hel1_31_208]
MQEKQNNIGLVWFRNDLRVQDNAVLHRAIVKHDMVIACYCFDPRHYEVSKFGFKKTEKFRAQFLIETITNLKHNLKALNIELFIVSNKPKKAIKSLVDTYKITSIYLQKEWTSEETLVTEEVKETLSNDINIHEIYDQFLYHPEDINMSFSDIPQVFTAFRKKIEKYSAIRPSIKNSPCDKFVIIENNTTIPTLETLGLETFKPHLKSAFPFDGGESSALERLDDYFFKTKKLGVYKKTRNGLVGKDFSSKFSAWLANGSISARTIYWEVKRFEREHFKNESTYWLIFELIWRDYFKYISLKHQNEIFKIGGILRKEYDWKSNDGQIQKWINGETRSSFVNANMLELKKTGWMSNRGRQNVASFFAKDMLLDWRIGAAYFESLLVDYDVHSNYGNWMYVAGVGNDPRDRKFNVDLQAERYDTNGNFQNLWLQETLF